MALVAVKPLFDRVGRGADLIGIAISPGLAIYVILRLCGRMEVKDERR